MTQNKIKIFKEQIAMSGMQHEFDTGNFLERNLYHAETAALLIKGVAHIQCSKKCFNCGGGVRKKNISEKSSQKPIDS